MVRGDGEVFDRTGYHYVGRYRTAIHLVFKDVNWSFPPISKYASYVIWVQVGHGTAVSDTSPGGGRGGGRQRLFTIYGRDASQSHIPHDSDRCKRAKSSLPVSRGVDELPNCVMLFQKHELSELCQGQRYT